VRWRDNATGAVTSHDIRHIFSMTGAVPSTGWLEGCVALDPEGFIKTGPDLSEEDRAAARWPLARPPHLLETSGITAAHVLNTYHQVDLERILRGYGEERFAKRVASAVGEGSIAITFVHQVLQE